MKTKNEQNIKRVEKGEFDQVKSNYLRSGCLIIGAFLMAFAVKCIFEPAGLVTGGFSGIAIIMEATIGIPLWVTTVALNIPLFVVAYFFLGKNVLVWSVFTTAFLTIFIAVIPTKNYFQEDIFLSMVIGSLVSGLGIGMILVWSVTSGGVDLLAMILNRYTKIKTVWLMFGIDGLIIGLGVVVFGIRAGAYSVISVFIVSYISDKIIEGPKTARAVYIISDNYMKIADAIMTEIGRGVTGFDTIGMYSDKGRRTLLCIAGKREISGIKKIVNELDKNAFLIISGVNEVRGEGFL